MKVRITKSNKESYWYADQIGKIFEVLEGLDNYRLVSDQDYFIGKDDASAIIDNQ
jgi:hypothetical protein